MSITSYKTDEIIPSSAMVRSFKTYLDKIQEKGNKKFAISRNSKVEAILISPQYLEEELKNILEHYEISKSIQARKKESANISLESIKKEYAV